MLKKLAEMQDRPPPPHNVKKLANDPGIAFSPEVIPREPFIARDGPVLWQYGGCRTSSRSFGPSTPTMDSKDRPEATVPPLPARRMMTPPALLGEASLLATSDGATGGTINIVQVMFSAITHHWWKMLAIWVVLSAGLAYAVHMRIKPLYETFSLLRVEPSHQDLFDLGMGSAEVFHHFLVTQVQLFTSPNVLVAARATATSPRRRSSGTRRTPKPSSAGVCRWGSCRTRI